MTTDPFTTIINEILQGLATELNGSIGPAIQNAGYDPFQNVTSGSTSIGVGTASYSVTNLTGISSLQLQQLVASNITAAGTSLGGQLNFSAALTSTLATNVNGSISVLLLHPSISGNIRLTGCSLSGIAQIAGSINGAQLCLNSISNLGVSFNYANPSIWIDDLGALNYLLQPLENIILDAAKGAISGLISSNINSIVAQQLNQRLPQCAPMT